MKTLLKEFKEFAVKGNVVDMAVGVIVGGAFGKIVTSLVNDVIMPLVGVLTGGIDFSNLFLPLDGNTYATLAEAEAAGAAVSMRRSASSREKICFFIAFKRSFQPSYIEYTTFFRHFCQRTECE